MATADGKPLLIGPYLELRAQSVNRQPTERVYLWTTDPVTGLGRMIDDRGGDLDRDKPLCRRLGGDARRHAGGARHLRPGLDRLRHRNEARQQVEAGADAQDRCQGP
ncbi:MAG: hypothetical protein WDN06_16035 [Asticcacaulis sp.]